MLTTKIRTITRYIAAAAILASLAFLVNFISASSGTAAGTADYHSALVLPETLSQKTLVEKIVIHRDFFMQLRGYDEHLLCDVSDELGDGTVGVLLLDSAEFLKSIVFDRNTHKKIHEDTSIPPKKIRAELTDSAISVSDARLIAGSIAGLREDTEKTRRKKTLHETPRREIYPQSLPEGFGPAGTGQKGGRGDVLEHLRRDVENNPNVSAMTSDEILERFRSDVDYRKEDKILQ
jgi:hypothetical protein